MDKYNKSTKLFIEQAISEGYKIEDIFVEDNGKKRRKAKTICPNRSIYITRLDHFKAGTRCGCDKCKTMSVYNIKKRKRFIKEFTSTLESINYKLIGEYVNAHTKVEIMCDKGHTYKVKPTAFEQGNRCPHCNIVSHGEELASRILSNYNIPFKREKMFDKLFGVGGGLMRFDFYLPQHNAIIEIQGEGHFEEYRTDFLRCETIENDKIKRKFCKDKNIKLYEVEYLQDKYGFKKALEKVEEEMIKIINEITE